MFQELVNELKVSIENHTVCIKRINRAMWFLLVLVVIAYAFISFFLDRQIATLMEAAKMVTASIGQSDVKTDPTELVGAANKNHIGLIVLGLFGSRLFAYFGELRHHYREQSKKETYLYSIRKIQAALETDMPEKVKATLLRDAFSTVSNAEAPVLSLTSETITKIVDSITEKVEKYVSTKGA